MAFAVRVTDLNDYIAPSQACVVTLNGQKKQGSGAPSAALTISETSEEIQLQPRATGTQLRLVAGPRQPNAPPPQLGDPVKVSLHDCLACSGCVTTAESILLEQQSTAELLAALRRQQEERCVVVVSVAPQSRAALAALAGLGPLDAWRRLVAWLQGLGVAHVCDIATARDLALLETAAEFVQRYRDAQAQGKLPAAASSGGGTGSVMAAATGAGPTTAAQQQLTRVAQAVRSAGPALHNGDHQHDPAASNGKQPAGASSAEQPLPMLASACPGWVCYAEKTQGAAVLPHISTAKSPQAIMGTLVKRLLAQELGVSDPSRVFHCSIMPCYDKKLEASRDEFTLPGTKVPEVDCCLTTVELHQLMVQHGVPDLSHVPPPPPPPQQHANGALPAAHGAGGEANGAQQEQQQPRAMESEPAVLAAGQPQQQQQRKRQWHQRQGGGAAPVGVAPLLLCDHATGGLAGLPGGSGGYMDFVFRVAAAELFGRQVPAGPLPLRQLRNSDFRDVELLDEAGRPLLRCAVANGFRNIQTLMRQVKSGRCPYHYVEVMACPSGCLNGGGQLKPSQPGQTAQQVLEAAEVAYHHADVAPRQPSDNELVPVVYARWVGDVPGSAGARERLHTHYRHRPKALAGEAGAEGAAVVAPTRLAADW